MKDLRKYNMKTGNKFMPIYKKRYRKNGEQFLKQVDEIDIEEDMKEKSLEISRIKEIYNIQERLKSEELIDNLTDEDFINELKEFEKHGKDMDMFQFLNMTAEIQEIYNKMPSDIRIKYKDLAKFTKEYIPELIDKQSMKLKKQQEIIKEQEKTTTINQTQIELEEKIKQLENQLKGENSNV